MEWDDESLCPYAWAQPLHQLNCDLVWPPEIDEPPYSHDAHSRFGRASSFGGHGPEDEHAYGCGHGTLSAEQEVREMQAFMDGKLDAKDGQSIKEAGSDWLGMTMVAQRTPYLELYTPEYAGRIAKKWVLEKLLAMAGIRLAGILNDVFQPLVGNLRRMWSEQLTDAPTSGQNCPFSYS